MEPPRRMCSRERINVVVVWLSRLDYPSIIQRIVDSSFSIIIAFRVKVTRRASNHAWPAVNKSPHRHLRAKLRGGAAAMAATRSRTFTITDIWKRIGRPIHHLSRQLLTCDSIMERVCTSKVLERDVYREASRVAARHSW